MRKLSEKEIKAIEIVKKPLLEEKRSLEGEIKIMDFKLYFELNFNYKKERRNIEKLKKQKQAILDLLNERIDTVDKQIKEGVKIKSSKE